MKKLINETMEFLREKVENLQPQCLPSVFNPRYPANEQFRDYADYRADGLDCNNSYG